MPEKPDEIENLKSTIESLLHSLNELINLQDTAKRILALQNEDEVYQALSSSLQEILKSSEFVVFIINPETKQVVEKICPDINVFDLKYTELPEDIIIWVIEKSEPVTIPFRKDSLLTVVPLIFSKKCFGYICINATATGETITPQLIELLSLIADITSATLSNIFYLKRIREDHIFILNILDSINNGIISIDKDAVITKINRNAAIMLEMSFEESAGKKIYDAIDDKKLSSVVRILTEETLTNGYALEQLCNYTTSEGTVLPLAINTAVLKDDEGNIDGVIFVFRDMTASQELARLRRIDQMKSEFLANVSHELRTPLTSILAYTDALLDMENSDATAKEFLQVINSEGQRLLDLIEDLLNISRIEAGRLKMNWSLTNPEEIVTEVLGISKFKTEKHKLITNINNNLTPTYMDKERMKEVVINLISNAIKYSPNGGEIKVSLNNEGNFLRLDVSDQGIGIPEEVIPKLFDRFYRVDSSLTYKVQGTGLGLAIIDGIVKAHNGKVEVKSKVNQGTTFSVFIPVRNMPPKEIPRGITE